MRFMLKPGLESCGGSSGSCLTLNGEDCCVGTLSFGWDTTDACNPTMCDDSTWTALTSSYPLTQLWDAIDVDFE